MSLRNRYHDIGFRYLMCVSKTMFNTLASICNFDICVRVRPRLVHWHRYVILIYVCE
ncbi:hypothetical protein F383_38235 [Gossypium arboreum]|uniref:Uncharacterized protein n=1 Tax=Gossypium arboreum TaxID=29729 RepID=A0A0B0MFB2_GOSAR|nr:hypothetical protein F383_38235 [Gossypium arboreum]